MWTRPAISRQELESRKKRWFRARVIALAALCSLGPLCVLYRAYSIQLAHGLDVADAEANHAEREITIAPLRGTVFDRHGESLAVSVDAESLWANPRMLRDAGYKSGELAYRLASLIGVDPVSTARRLASDKYFVWIKRHLTPRQASLIKEMNIIGLSTTTESKRYYPYRELASHLLGYSNIDGQGIEGLELSLDDVLRGKEQSIVGLVDRRGQLVYSRSLFDSEYLRGADVVLTLDKTLQDIAERALGAALETHAAKGASLVMVQPATGEILAMANMPTYNPNEPGRYHPEARRNRAVTDRFEPGSTVKPLTLAGALAAGVVSSNTWIDCENGKMEIDDYTVHDSMHYGKLSLRDVLAKSSNVGVAKIAARMGRAQLYNVMHRFGFGDLTDVPLPGENQGILRDYHSWYDADVATIAFGQGIGVTNLQLAMAVAALANGGTLMEPLLVRDVIGSGKKALFSAKAKVRRRVVPEDIARLLTDMMVGVTQEGGTGVDAAITGFRVAGKTGTAQKADERRSGYADKKWTSSFVGFVPAEDPQLVISVVIDEPQHDIYYGGEVAGPVFKQVGAQALAYMGLLPRLKAHPEKSVARRVNHQRHRQHMHPRHRAARHAQNIDGLRERSAAAKVL